MNHLFLFKHFKHETNENTNYKSTGQGWMTKYSDLIVWRHNHPADTKHLYDICTTSAQRLRRWSNIVQMLYKSCVHWVVISLCGVMHNFRVDVRCLYLIDVISTNRMHDIWNNLSSDYWRVVSATLTSGRYNYLILRCLYYWFFLRMMRLWLVTGFALCRADGDGYISTIPCIPGRRLNLFTL